jgi:hypothetical protein
MQRQQQQHFHGLQAARAARTCTFAPRAGGTRWRHLPGGGRGFLAYFFTPKPDKPLKKHQQVWDSAWSSGLAQD